MDEGRKRVVGIMAAILARFSLPKTFDTEKVSGDVAIC